MIIKMQSEQAGRPDEVGYGGAAGTDLLERTETRQVIEPGDQERFSHYVQKEKILESAVTGTPVIALCGKVWIPGRDPQKFPICPTCKEMIDSWFGPEDGSGEDGER